MGPSVRPGEPAHDGLGSGVMDARLVWNTWRRILRNDQLVACVLHGASSEAEEMAGLTADERTILADYMSTRDATDTNIGMYRRGLVRNGLAALTLLPMTQRLLELSGLDQDTVAEDVARSTGYVDQGPNVWTIAGGFVAHLGTLREFAGPPQQDVLALDAATVALARRLGEHAPLAWPDSAAGSGSGAERSVGGEPARFVASGAAVLASSCHDLTAWIENPYDFDAGEPLDVSSRQWLIYFPAADAAQTYAELSQRAGGVFTFLSVPKTCAEVSRAFGDLSATDVLDVIDSLVELGVVVREQPV